MAPFIIGSNIIWSFVFKVSFINNSLFNIFFNIIPDSDLSGKFIILIFSISSPKILLINSNSGKENIYDELETNNLISVIVLLK